MASVVVRINPSSPPSPQPSLGHRRLHVPTATSLSSASPPHPCKPTLCSSEWLPSPPPFWLSRRPPRTSLWLIQATSLSPGSLTPPPVTHFGTLSPRAPDPPVFLLCVATLVPALTEIQPCPQATRAVAPIPVTRIPCPNALTPCRLLTDHPQPQSSSLSLLKPC